MKVSNWFHKFSKPATLPLDNNANISEDFGRVWWYEIYAVFSVCYSCISCGNFLGYTSSSVPSMQSDLNAFSSLSSKEISLIGSLGPLGGLFGSLCTLIPLRLYGPRRTVGLLGIPTILASWIIIGVFSSHNINLIFLARVMGGIGCGVIISCVPLYVMDVSSVFRRGKLGIMPQFLMIFGILVSYVLGSMLDWRALACASAVITIPGWILLLFAPDSPQWLVNKGELNKSLEILEKLNGQKKAGEILQNMKTNLEKNQNNKSTRWNLGMLKAFIFALGLVSIQQLTGINGVTFFALTIFKQSAPTENSSNSGHIPSIILAMTQLLASFISTFFVERFGRKFLLSVSSATTTFAGITLGLYFYFSTKISYLPENLSWVPLLALVVFAFGFAIGLGPITWILVAEILPQDTRHLMNPIVIAFNWLCIFLVTGSFPWLREQIHFYGIFWIYAGVGILGFIFFRFIPETKGKSQQEIQALFTPKNCSSNFKNLNEV